MPKKSLKPERVGKHLKDMLEQAIALKNRDDFEGAIQVLARAVRAHPDCASAWGLRGGIYLYELERPKEAIPCFRRVTKLSPLSEHGSLGLFHSLWQCGFHAKALAEMKRFLSVSHSADYAEIAAELIEKSMSP
jgi:tetratricopeptide (TPR) repeat protein